MKERLQKILARAGFGSRRACETLITSGRVRVNGRIAARLGAQAEVGVDRIEVDARRVIVPTVHVFLAMHKPAGYVTTLSDTHERPTVMRLLPDHLPPHVVPVGRLDMNSEGLLLFTSDGELAHRVTHPRFKIDKEYHALVRGVPPAATLERLRRGVTVDGKRTLPAEAEIARPPAMHEPATGATWLRLIVHEGRERQVRLMCAASGFP